MIYKFKKQNRGFTVLESIVAIFILSLSISGAFAAVRDGLSDSAISKDEVKAFYLAQEAVEIIKNKRDSNQLSKLNGDLNTWLTGISENPSDPCYFGKVCMVDVVTTNFVNCGDDWDTCPNLKKDPNTFLYSYGAFPETNFKREIKFELVRSDSFNNPVEVFVVVKIYWTKGLDRNSFEIKTTLFNLM